MTELKKWIGRIDSKRIGRIDGKRGERIDGMWHERVCVWSERIKGQ